MSDRQNNQNENLCTCMACETKADRTRPGYTYKRLMEDPHSAFVTAVRWYENEQSLEPWREIFFLDSRNAIADFGTALRNGECRIEIMDVCRCLDVYKQAVHNHQVFLARVRREKAMLSQEQQESAVTRQAAEALLGVASLKGNGH